MVPQNVPEPLTSRIADNQVARMDGPSRIAAYALPEHLHPAHSARKRR
jgi:hypothetical protein